MITDQRSASDLFNKEKLAVGIEGGFFSLNNCTRSTWSVSSPSFMPDCR